MIGATGRRNPGTVGKGDSAVIHMQPYRLQVDNVYMRFLICLFLMVIFWNPMRALAEEPEVELLQSVQVMLAAQGHEWLAVRDAFLQRSEIERAAVLLHLARADATKNEKTLGLILRTRIEQPAGVESYESSLLKDTTQPMIGRNGRPVYGYYGTGTSPENYGLIVEHVWKRTDLPEVLRLAYIGYVANRAQEVDSLLVLLEYEPRYASTLALAISAVPAAGDDPRVPAALLTSYVNKRSDKPESTDAARLVMVYTSWLGTPLARDAVLQMHAFERDFMIQRGKAPWNDDQNQALAAHREASRTTSLTRQQPFEVEAEREAAIASAQADEKAAWIRVGEILLWNSFAEAYDKLRELGVPVEEPPVP